MFDRSPKPKVPVAAAGRAPDRGAAAPRAAEPAHHLAFVTFDLDKVAFGRPGPGGRPMPSGLRLDAPPRDPSTQRIVRPAAIKPLAFTPEAIAARPPRLNHVGLPPTLKVPVRRLTLFIESSLLSATRWAVFEPNTETLWSALRLEVGSFLAGLSQPGAFYDDSVACDATTTTPDDIALGRVNMLVRIAPVKPVEFVVLQIQQTAGATPS